MSAHLTEQHSLKLKKKGGLRPMYFGTLEPLDQTQGLNGTVRQGDGARCDLLMF